jgi:hypothetical protein
MTQTISSYKDDPALIARVEDGLELPFKWDPAATTRARALEESRRFWQDPGGAPTKREDGIQSITCIQSYVFVKPPSG